MKDLWVQYCCSFKALCVNKFDLEKACVPACTFRLLCKFREFDSEP